MSSPKIITHTINLESGPVFEIELTENASTGYSWQAEFDKNLFALLSDTYKNAGENTGSRNAIGAPTTRVMRFELLGKSEAELLLNYARPWGNNKPAEQRIYKVVPA